MKNKRLLIKCKMKKYKYVKNSNRLFQQETMSQKNKIFSKIKYLINTIKIKMYKKNFI